MCVENRTAWVIVHAVMISTGKVPSRADQSERPEAQQCWSLIGSWWQYLYKPRHPLTAAKPSIIGTNMTYRPPVLLLLCPYLYTAGAHRLVLVVARRGQKHPSTTSTRPPSRLQCVSAPAQPANHSSSGFAHRQQHPSHHHFPLITKSLEKTISDRLDFYTSTDIAIAIATTPA